MASHDLEHQPNERLITEIANLKKQVSELRTLQLQGTAATNMTASGVYQSIAPATVDGSATLFRFNITSVEKKMIFAHFYFTLWEDSEAPANVIGDANILQYGYRVYHRTEWSTINLPVTGYNQSEYIWVENHRGATHDIIVKGEWRYIVNGGSIGVS